MATSGSTDFNLNRDAIISAALRKLRVVDPRQDVPAIHITNGAIALNTMIKSWQTDGIYLWLNEEIVLHLQYNTQSYTLGPNGDNAAKITDAFKTQLSADAASGAGTIDVDSDDSIENGDYIGIQLDGGTIQWTTVNGAPAGDTVTLTANLTGAASTDNYVFTYTNKISRPLKIVEARVRDTNDVDEQLRIITSREEYFSQTDKTTQGETLDLYYHPGLTDGKLYTWPVAGTSDITDRIVMTVQRTIEDFDAQANNFDGPVDVINPIIWNLAVELAPEFGVDLTSGKGAMVAAQAGKLYQQVKRTYGSMEPVQLRP